MTHCVSHHLVYINMYNKDIFLSVCFVLFQLLFLFTAEFDLLFTFLGTTVLHFLRWSF